MTPEDGKKLKRGETIGLKVQLGDLLKIREVKVIDTMGKVLRVQDEKRQRVVRYSDVERLADDKATTQKRATSAPIVSHRAPVASPRIEVISAPRSDVARDVQKPTPTLEDFGAFLAMAEEMLPTLTMRAAEIVRQIRELDAERSNIDREIDVLKAESDELDQRLRTLRALVRQ